MSSTQPAHHQPLDCNSSSSASWQSGSDTSDDVQALEVSDVDQSQFVGHNEDWLQLPAGCREHIVKRMDSVTRAAWRLVCLTACHDVYAVTSTLTWQGHDAEHLYNTDVHWSHLLGVAPTTTLPTALFAKLPSLHNLNCSFMSSVTSIQGIPSTLRSLDLSDWDYLEDLAPLQHCTALEQLTITGDLGEREGLAATLPPAMSAISPHLRRLTFGVQGEPSDAVAEAVVRSLACLTGLQELCFMMQPDADYGGSDWRHWPTLAQAVGGLTDLRALAIDESLCRHNGDTVLHLGPAIAQLKRLQSLNLRGIMFDAEVAEAVAQSLCSMPAMLTRLDIRDGHVYEPDHPDIIPVLVTALQAHSATLKAVVCTLRTGCDDAIGPQGFMLLAPGLRCCTALTELDLGGSDICAEGSAALATALSGSAPRLTSLNLSGNFLEREGAAALAPELSRMTALATLGYCQSQMYPAGAVTLAPALLSIAPSLTSLDISASCVGDDGIVALAPAMRSMTALRHFSCFNNEMGCVGAAALASALPFMTRLKYLDLSRNNLGYKGLKALARGLEALPGQQLWRADFRESLVTTWQTLCYAEDIRMLDVITYDLNCFSRLEVRGLHRDLPKAGGQEAVDPRIFGLEVSW